MTAARRRYKAGVEHKMTCVSALPTFLFVPSLIWLAFGRRRVEDIFYDVGKLMPEKYMLFKNHHGMAYMP